MVKRKRGETPKVKIEDKITIADWLNYLEQISTVNLNYYLTLYSMVIGFSAILMVVVVYVNTRLEGLSELTYKIEEVNANENISRIVFNLTKIPGIIEHAHWIIILVASLIVACSIYYFNRSKKTLLAVSADKLIRSILSQRYPKLKNIDAIEESWETLREEIKSMHLRERSRLLNKKNEEPLNIWFDSIINQISHGQQK